MAAAMQLFLEKVPHCFIINTDRYQLQAATNTNRAIIFRPLQATVADRCLQFNFKYFSNLQ